MKKLILTIVVVASLVCLLQLSRSGIERAKQTPTAPLETLARIEPDITITKSDLDRLMQKIESEYPRQYITYTSKMELLTQIINLEVLYKEALRTRFPAKSQLKRNVADEYLRHILAQQFTPVTEEDCRQHYETNRSDFDTIRASHILIKYAQPDGAAKQEEALRKIQTIRDTLLSDPSSFPQLARQFSQDGTAPNGGDLGWFSYGGMVEPFSRAAFDLKKKGDFTHEPIQTQYGYHLILLTDEKRGFNNFRDSIQERLTVNRKQAIINNFIASALKKYPHTIYDENVRKNYPPPWPSPSQMTKMREFYQVDLDEAKTSK